MMESRRWQSMGGFAIRRPFEEGKVADGVSVSGNRRKLQLANLAQHVKARIQEERRQIGLPEIVDWPAFAEEAISIPTKSGPLWVGSDDPRVERYMKRKKKLEEKPMQLARKQPKADAAKELETHPMREYFSTPSDLNNPITIADGLAKAGMIKPHEVKHMATQLKWKPRPPIVTIMGHVDHGKTTLLDYLRNTNVAAGEAGGITQSIGAFRVNVAKVLRRERGEAEPVTEEQRRAEEAAEKLRQKAMAPRGAATLCAADDSTSGKPVVSREEIEARRAQAAAEQNTLSDAVSDYVTFIDTPGHAAFKEMRESGASATDLALLIVSAVDGVQPQTEECVKILLEKHVPYVVVFNKIDREPDVARHRKALVNLGVEFEEDGGDVMSIGVSALHGDGVPDLLEMIQLQTSLLELATPEPARAEILVIDSHNKYKGAVAGIVRTGQARVGMTFASGTTYAVCRGMRDETGEGALKTAAVGEPVLVEGFKVLPKPGVVLFQLKNDDFGDKYHKLMKDVYKAEGSRETYLQMLNLESQGKIYDRKPDNNERAVFDGTPFNLVVKASSFGQMQAVMRLLYELPPLEGVQLNIKGAEVGGLGDYDVLGLMGKQQPGGVLVFGKTTHENRLDLPEFIEVHECQVVYHGVDWVKEKLVSLMPKLFNERVVAAARVKQTFRASQAGSGNAGGLDVMEGTLVAKETFRVMRPVKNAPAVKVYEGRCREVRRFKEQVPSVEKGLECGMIMHDDFTFRTGDMVEQIVKDVIERDVGEEWRNAAERERVERLRREREEGVDGDATSDAAAA